MSYGSDLKAAVTGNIETAMLVIHDYRQTAKNLKESGASEAETLAAIRNDRNAGTMAALATGSAPSFPNSTDRTLRVQFNPSRLTLDSSAVPRNQQDALTGRARTMAVEDAKLNLTVILYFDDMDTYDAFMWERFTAGTSVKGVANVVKAGLEVAGKGKKHSVQWQVEALVSALRNPYTRTVSFRWADFAFIGQLNTVRANYTMFSPSGRPVRAEVLLRIQHEMDPAMLQRWYDNFEKAFGGESSNLVKNEQNYSALLNLNL